MNEYKNEGREIFYGYTMELFAIVYPINGQYDQAIGFAYRIASLLNSAKGLTLDDVEKCLMEFKSKIGEKD